MIYTIPDVIYVGIFVTTVMFAVAVIFRYAT